jgi:hypothetical protein
VREKTGEARPTWGRAQANAHTCGQAVVSSVLALFGRPHDLLELEFQLSVSNVVSTNIDHLIGLADEWDVQAVPVGPGAAATSSGSDWASDDCIAIIVDAPEVGALRTVDRHWVLLVQKGGGVYCWDPEVERLFRLTEAEAREAFETHPGVRFLRPAAG